MLNVETSVERVNQKEQHSLHPIYEVSMKPMMNVVTCKKHPDRSWKVCS